MKFQDPSMHHSKHVGGVKGGIEGLMKDGQTSRQQNVSSTISKLKAQTKRMLEISMDVHKS